MNQKTFIYHITRKENLDSILKNGGVFSIREIEKNNIRYKSSAYADIQDRRSRALVKTHENGILHDYVPFYFSPRSPMLYANFKRKVELGINTQEDIIYLVAVAENVVKKKIPFSFTDGHAAMEISHFFTDLKDLKEIDWPLMKSRFWMNKREDNDRKRRRQAEFLVKSFFPFDLVSELVVYDESRKDFVSSVLLENKIHGINVKVRAEWYYEELKHD